MNLSGSILRHFKQRFHTESERKSRKIKGIWEDVLGRKKRVQNLEGEELEEEKFKQRGGK